MQSLATTAFSYRGAVPPGGRSWEAGYVAVSGVVVDSLTGQPLADALQDAGHGVHAWLVDGARGAALLAMSFALLGTWGALYAYTPELYPTELRATGMGVAGAMARVGGLLAPSAIALAVEHRPLLGGFGRGVTPSATCRDDSERNYAESGNTPVG